MLTFVLAAVAIATCVAALAAPAAAALRRLALAARPLGIPAQAVIGGITVLTDLNPWVVSFHLLLSLAMIGAGRAAAAPARRARRPGPARWSRPVGAGLGDVRRRLGWCCTSARWSPAAGPHAGDADAAAQRPRPACSSASCTPTWCSCWSA